MKPKDADSVSDGTTPGADFYIPLFKPFDPYLFTYR